MKKIVSLILVVCMVFSFASATGSEPTEDIAPLYEQLIGMSSLLKINSLGYAEAYGTATVRAGYNVEATIELQKLDGNWNTISSYTSSGTGILGTKPYIKMFVVHGTYQAKVTAVVTDSYGNHIETQTALSQVVRY